MEPTTEATAPTKRKRREFHTFRNEVSGRGWSLLADAVSYIEMGRYGNPLLLLSAVGPGTSIKAIAATLHGNEQISFRCDHLGGYNVIGRSDHGYSILKHAVGYGQYHMLARANDSRLMLTVSTESLWHRLRSADFTTPILKAWMPWLLVQLRKNDLLFEPRQFGCRCGILNLNDKSLDTLVSDGLKSGEIKVE